MVNYTMANKPTGKATFAALPFMPGVTAETHCLKGSTYTTRNHYEDFIVLRCWLPWSSGDWDVHNDGARSGWD